jgi:anaerobic magnesium-protoporphyrin IX monomethyl ester cyclase
MRVGLVDVMDKSGIGNGPNVAVAALAGYLERNGHQVEVLDLFHATRAERRRFAGEDLGLVGISASSFDFDAARRFAAMVKREGTPVVLGGPHASVTRGGIMAEPSIDYAVYGEGEVPLLRLVQALEAERRPGAAQLRAIDGLVFREGGAVVVNRPQPRLTDLDSLPLPSYRRLPMGRYAEHHVSTSRGCPFACAFCASGAILGKKWIAKSAARVVEEIEVLVRDFGRKPIWIVDDSFNLEPSRVKEICRLLLERELGVSWVLMAGLRADRVDLEMLQLMKAAGCQEFGVGIESSDPEVLREIGKGETIEEIARGITLAREAGFLVAGSLMIGNPGDTLQTVRRSLEFARAQGLDVIFVYHALPFPNTRLWDWVQAHGRFLRTDFANFEKYVAEPVFETPEFPRADRIAAQRLALELFPRANPGMARERSLGGLVHAFQGEWREHGLASAACRMGRFTRRRLFRLLPRRLATSTRAPPA